MTATPVALLLSAWLGAGALFAAAVAPAAFAVLPSRSLAGALVGRVLPVLFLAGLVVSVLSLWLDRPNVGRAPKARRALLVTAALACAAAQFAVTPRIERVREQIGGAIEQLPASDARRAAFGRLHAASVGLLGLAMVAAGSTLVFGALPHKRRGSERVSDALRAFQESQQVPR